MNDYFVDKLYHLFCKSRGGGQSRFMAFCILLKCINFTPNENFINYILSNISKHRLLYKNLLIGRKIRNNSTTKFNLKYADIDYILESLFYLNTRISSSLMHSLCNKINDAELEKYLKGLCYSYFNLIKTGKINKFNQLSISHKIKYLKRNIPSTKNNRYSCYGPQMPTNSGIWGEPIPFHIISIPMGGSNKKY